LGAAGEFCLVLVCGDGASCCSRVAQGLSLRDMGGALAVFFRFSVIEKTLKEMANIS